jgi:hypothetical protein
VKNPTRKPPRSARRKAATFPRGQRTTSAAAAALQEAARKGPRSRITTPIKALQKAARRVGDRPRSRLLVKWRGNLDVMPAAEIVIPDSVIKRKSAHFVAEMHGFVQIEQAWDLIRGAIDDALKTPRRTK